MHVHHAVHQQAAVAATVRRQREGERQLGPHTARRGEALAQGAADEALDHASEIGHVLGADDPAVALDQRLDLVLRGDAGPAHVELLEQLVHHRAPKQRRQLVRAARLRGSGLDRSLDSRRLLLAAQHRQAQRALEVEAVAAALIAG